MTVLAQVGFGPKDKLDRGLAERLIDGAILSPRYLNGDDSHLSDVKRRVDDLQQMGARVLWDPEYYAARYISHPEANLGNLETWDYFQTFPRAALISGVAIPEIIKRSLEVQRELGVDEWIAPNIYIDAADSVNTAISLGFIGRTKDVSGGVGEKPVFATLALSRNALMARRDFEDVFDALTSIDQQPDGYYILVGSESAGPGNHIRSDLYTPDVIAGWMYINYVFAINGYRAINGFCHLMSPLMGICGAEATASGWFSGLRCFSMNKYIRRAGGGRAPIVRYVSNALLARVKLTDYLAYVEVVPEVANNLESDYLPDREPTRTDEALQSWDALSALWKASVTGNIEKDLDSFLQKIEAARHMWTALREAGFSDEIEPNMERLEALSLGIGLFRQWAELD